MQGGKSRASCSFHVPQQILCQFAKLSAGVCHEAQGHVHAEPLVEEVPHLYNLERIQAQLVKGLLLNSLPAATILGVLQQEVLHALPHVDATRRRASGSRRGCRRLCLHSRWAQVVTQELQDREVAPLRARPVHVTCAELRGRRLCLPGHAQGRCKASQRRGVGQRGVAVLQRLLVGLRADLGHAGLGPRAPVDGHHAAGSLVALWQLSNTAKGCKLVQNSVGCAVVDLPGVAKERRGRGEAHGPAQGPRQGLAGTEQRREEVALGACNLAHALLSHALHNAVIEDAREVQHSGDTAELAEGAGKQRLLAVDPLHLDYPAFREHARERSRACTTKQQKLLGQQALLLQHPLDDRLAQAACGTRQDEDWQAAICTTLREARKPGAGLGHRLQPRGVDGAMEGIVLNPQVHLLAVPLCERKHLRGARLHVLEASRGQEDPLDLKLACLQSHGLAGPHDHGATCCCWASKQQPPAAALLEQTLDQLDEVPGLADLSFHGFAVEHGPASCHNRLPGAYGGDCSRQ
mmetsp:Transcript_1151/g.3093  ORF Transcript_1151/g.3093 Transcript_1151/m.3093 type:complete len:521 (-) Transcript_1151:213-1775(-)